MGRDDWYANYIETLIQRDVRDLTHIGHLGALPLLLALAASQTLHHLRDKDGYEVDIVVQRGTRYVGIEVKAASSLSEGDFRGLERLREMLGTHFHSGVVLYDGEHVLPFGERLLAVPLSALWARGVRAAAAAHAAEK